MVSLKKRSRDMIQEGFEKKGTSSYGHLKMKFAACKCKIEKERLEVLVHVLRKELQETLITKDELEAIVQGILCESGMEEDCDPANNDTSLGSSYHAMKTKHWLPGMVLLGTATTVAVSSFLPVYYSVIDCSITVYYFPNM
jgi:hypothetical protein